MKFKLGSNETVFFSFQDNVLKMPSLYRVIKVWNFIIKGHYSVLVKLERRHHTELKYKFLKLYPTFKCFKINNESFFNSFPNRPWFFRICSISLLKTLWEKEKLLIMSNFSFSHIVFYLFREFSAIFINSEIVVCKLFQFGRV